MTRADLLAAIIVARWRYEQLRELEEWVGDLRGALGQRTAIGRVKGILTPSEGLTEHDALCRLQRNAQDRRVRMTDIAEESLASIDTSLSKGK